MAVLAPPTEEAEPAGVGQPQPRRDAGQQGRPRHTLGRAVRGAGRSLEPQARLQDEPVAPGETLARPGREVERVPARVGSRPGVLPHAGGEAVDRLGDRAVHSPAFGRSPAPEGEAEARLVPQAAERRVTKDESATGAPRRASAARREHEIGHGPVEQALDRAAGLPPLRLRGERAGDEAREGRRGDAVPLVAPGRRGPERVGGLGHRVARETHPGGERSLPRLRQAGEAQRVPLTRAPLEPNRARGEAGFQLRRALPLEAPDADEPPGREEPQSPRERTAGERARVREGREARDRGDAVGRAAGLERRGEAVALRAALPRGSRGARREGEGDARRRVPPPDARAEVTSIDWRPARSGRTRGVPPWSGSVTSTPSRSTAFWVQDAPRIAKRPASAG